MPLIETKGAASAQGFGLSLGGAEKVYIEDVFSTYLYTGNDSTQTITNGINLSGKGGLVWIKPRNQAQDHIIFDTVGGITKSLTTNNTAAQYTATAGNEGLASFNNNGFTAKLFQNSTGINNSACNNASWTFRKQPKFFDIVTYTGNGATGRNISHNLGSVPGCIIVRRYDTIAGWDVYHQSLGATKAINLHSTGAAFTDTIWNSTSPTSTVFTVSGSANTSSGTYVAYLFAHNAGGFGLSGTDNVISCGSFTGAATTTVNLGWEPQWILWKRSDGAGNWEVFDTMRGWSEAGGFARLWANTSDAESTYMTGPPGAPTATGFTFNGFLTSGATYIYIAIRRGPMKVPTSGTSVFNPVTRTGTGTSAYSVTGAGFSPDSIFIRSRNNASGRNWNNFDRLRGIQNDLIFGLTNVETNNSDKVSSYDMGGYSVPATPSATLNASGENFIDYLWKRAPNFMDVVCYTGTGGGANAYQDVAHNLGVTPELIIVKQRNAVNATAPYDWPVYQKDITSNGVGVAWMVGNAAKTTDYLWRRGASGQKIDASTFSLNGNYLMSNESGGTYVAYLFATCAGVSKVGSYTGNGSSQTINCGFTGGARFVLIKRTDSTGDWYVWDTARGIVAGNDPYLGLNTYVNEVTTNDTIDPDSTGFIVNQLAATNINVSSATYIFLAIA